MSHTEYYFKQVSEIAKQIDYPAIESIAYNLRDLRENKGRLFVLGVGGSAGNASHAVNDFRKLCDIEAYAPTDNVSELTARTNDEGWESVFKGWLLTSNLSENDALFILSVGGGNSEKKVSVNLVNAIDLAISKRSKILGIVGKPDGYAVKKATSIVIVPNFDPNLITPHSEAFQAVIWHSLVSNPILQTRETKW
ncbi:MAG: SIS domain-containing protein [Pseudomonadota bacterium]|nr:SIS domain-containing protein [Pseudomonadota bacterium]